MRAVQAGVLGDAIHDVNALVRQIAEAHEGGISLLARDDARGTMAQPWPPYTSLLHVEA